MAGRYVTLSEGRRVSLAQYVMGVKYAKAHPDVRFPTGLTCWYPCSGADIVRQFREGMHERITQGTPYAQRGL